jgi:methionyl-tRNA synthetase
MADGLIRNCPFCGKENPSDASNCEQCGKSLRGSEGMRTEHLSETVQYRLPGGEFWRQDGLRPVMQGGPVTRPLGVAGRRLGGR